MRKLVFFLMMLACGMQLSAQSAEQTEEQAEEQTLTEVQDTIVCNHPLPQHLQAAVSRRAAAAVCPTDSIVGLDSAGQPSSLVYYEYDSDGNTAGETQYTWVGGVKTGVSRVRKEYRGSTAVVTVNYQWSGGAWTGRDSTVLLYDGSTNTGSASYTFENGAWREETLYEYACNAAGRRTFSQYRKWSAATQTLQYVEKYEWNFDDAGNQLKNSYWVWSNGAWVGKTNAITAYDENKNKTLEEKYSGWENNDWKGTSKNTYVYNSAKQVTEQVEYAWSGGWVKKTKTVKDYSGTYVTENAIYTWNGVDWAGTSRTTKTYTGSKTDTETDWTWNEETEDWDPFQLTEYTYTGSKVLTKTVSQRIGEEWVGVSQLKNTYDSSGRIERESTYARHGETWADSLQTEYTYNSNGINTLMTAAKWDGSTWQTTYSFRREVTYVLIDSKEYTTSDMQEEWTASSGKWTGKSRVETKYDAAGNIIQTDTYKFSAGGWVNNVRKQYEFKENNRLWKTLDVSMTWDSGRKRWKGTNKYEYDFNAAGKQIMISNYKWNSDAWDWMGVSKSEVVYDGNKETVKFAYTWNSDAWDWMVMFRYNYTYDAAGRKRTEYVFRYDALSDEYVNVTHQEYEYDAKGRTIRTDTYEWIEELDDWCMQAKEESSYDTDSDSKLRSQLNATWSNCVLTAYNMKQYHYACDPKYYTVRFLDWDGKELQSEKLLEGTKPEYRGEKPERAADAQYTYTFAGWDKEIAAVAGEASYKATYSSTLNQYTVTFYDEDGTTKLWSGEFDYGTTPVYGGSEPEKTSDAQYTYTFAGWDKEIASVSGEASYTATYSSTLNRYTVTFYDEDGTTKLWSGEFDYGTTPVYGGSEPEKTADVQYTYTFAGWDKEIAAVSGEASYKATYSSTLNQYTVTFYDEDGTTKLWSGEFDYGTTPAYGGSEPEKTADAQYTYTFAGWDKELAAVTGEASYTATYNSTLNQYTVTFYDEDGTTKLWSGEFDYGTTPVYGGGTPEKTADAQYTYTFAGWDNEIVAVTGEASYKATYSTTLNKYTVTFYDEDGTKILWKEVLDYGATPVYKGEKPMKEGNQQYSYSFMGWDEDIVPVTGDAVYKAVFMQNINKFTVTFRDADGVTELQSQNYEYGQVPVYEGVTPTKTGDAQYSYVFDGWDKEVTAVTEYTVYTAQYREVVNEYLVTFYDEDGTTVLWSGKFEYGATAVYGGTAPATTGDAQYSHVFKGWNRELGVVTGETSYTAQYEDVLNMYRITFYDEDGETVLDSREWEYGSTPAYMGTTPVKAEDENYTYSFSGWDKEIAAVTGEASYTASYTATAKTPTSIGGMQEKAPKAVKVVENGVMYIIIDGVKYDATGLIIDN